MKKVLASLFAFALLLASCRANNTPEDGASDAESDYVIAAITLSTPEMLDRGSYDSRIEYGYDSQKRVVSEKVYYNKALYSECNIVYEGELPVSKHVVTVNSSGRESDTVYSYSGTKLIKETTIYSSADKSNGAANITVNKDYSYDSEGRIVKTVESNSTDPDNRAVKEYSYNDDGTYSVKTALFVDGAENYSDLEVYQRSENVTDAERFKGLNVNKLTDFDRLIQSGSKNVVNF